MQLKTYILLGLCFLFFSDIPNTGINKKNLFSHVRFLSADSLEGRQTGTIGEKRATQYIANIFHQLGLEPAGDHGTFFQKFNFTAGVVLGKNNSFLITTRKGGVKRLILGIEWQPLSFSNSTTFETSELVFAGYGIEAPALGKFPPYHSYEGLDVKNKWVIAYRDMPKKISAEQSHQISPYASLRYKTYIAQTHGAKGIIFANPPDSKEVNELIPFSCDTSLSGAGIVALSIKNATLMSLLNTSDQASLAHVREDIASMIGGIKISGEINIVKNIKHGRNVLAKLRLDSNAKQLLVVSAHVDHLGRGELSGSRAREDEVGMIHPGADDNASGVASILETAAALSHLKAQGKLYGNKDIVFAAWSGEEFGILGSSHFVNHFKKTTSNQSLRPAIEAAINLDMVGHLRESLVLQGVGSSLEWPKLINQIKVKHPLSLITQSDPYLPTDSTSLYLQGVPTLNLFTGAHDDYHTPRDKPETLNYDGIKTISEFLVDLILTLEKRSHSMGYQKVSKSSDNAEREFKIYLGTIPDYASADVSGVKLSGATKNSPADHAGIKQNDIIIELDGKKIHDIYDYTYALNALPIGRPVKVVVLRTNTKVVLMIVPRYRA